MSTSYPSRPVVAIDVPEVRKFDAQFVYNFFTNDESVNDEPNISGDRSSIINRSTTKDDTRRIFLEKSPRYVKFVFSPVQLKNATQMSLRPLIQENLNLIQSEQQFSNAGYTRLGFQDTALDGKLFLLVSGTLARKINSQNEQTKDEVQKVVNKIGDQLKQASLLESSKFLFSTTGEEISSEFILASLNDLERLGYKFLDSKEQEEMINSKFESLKTVSIKGSFNNKIVGTMLRKSLFDPLNIYADEIQSVLPDLQAIQDQVVQLQQPDIIKDNEYEIVVDYVSRRKVSQSSFNPKARVLGYIIDKYEVRPDGTTIKKQPIVAEGPNTSTVYDFRISYGKTYYYAIRTIVEMEILALDQTDEFYAVTLLISSSPALRRVVTCHESVPPPAPYDFNVYWDFNERAARLMWSFPPNPQRDIKRFQVFRRPDITEPFQLIKEYNFDDSLVSYDNFETPDFELVDNLSSPLTYFIDKEFTKSSRFIYSVCSVDAHGLSSNYSMQFEVWFDRFANKIKKKLISSSGAPKTYPNWFLNQDTFVDVMKDSGHTKLSLYFDPEYYKVTQKASSLPISRRNEADQTNGIQDLKVMATPQNGGYYKLQFINVDVQQSAVVDIVVNDLTSLNNVAIRERNRTR